MKPPHPLRRSSSFELTSSTPVLQLPVLQPIEDGLRLLLIGAVFSAFLVPLAVVVLYSSSSYSKRRPLFIANLLAIALGLGEGAFLIHIFTNLVVLGLPDDSFPHITAFLALVFLVPIFVQAILLFKIVAVYPRRLLTSIYQIAICCPLVALKLARVVIVVLLLSSVHHDRHVSRDPWTHGYAKVACFLQLFDDIYASALLVMRPKSRSRDGKADTHHRHCRAFSTAVASGFVLPVLLDIAQVILVFGGSEGFASKTYIPLASSFVQIICLSLATLLDPEPRTRRRPPNSKPTRVAPSESAAADDHDHDRTGPADSHRDTDTDTGDKFASWAGKAFTESVRDSNTQVGEDDAEERLKWLAELGKEQAGGAGATPQTSLCPSVMLDNTGQPIVYYAV
ncbi:hypothetical protein C8Q80DRAFT_897114 [Daedaleopsis nitida]|nr:hypothetical protein C8Q80DRAFT_897114 [Daedaleopsis nitida]